MVKALIGYGISLVVLFIVLTYAIRSYLKVRRDHVHKLARKDSKTLQLTSSAQYSRSFLGAPVAAGDWSDAPRTEVLIGPQFNATTEGRRLRLIDDTANMN
jgi:hypothetical protein